MKMQRVSFTVDNVSIIGELRLPDGADCFPSLCICHGIPSGKPADPDDKGYPSLAEKFCAAGFVTLIFNFRGTGPSGGNFDIMGWVHDLGGAIDYLYGHPQVDRSRLYLMGFSGGAAVSTYVAAHDPRISGVILCACPSEFRRVVDQRKGDFSIEHFRQTGLIRDRDFPHSVDAWLNHFREVTPIKWIGQIAPRPLLVLQGKDDDLVDEEQAWNLYEKAGGPKEIAVVAGAGHKLRLSEEAMNIALTWLKKAQPDGSNLL